MGTAPSALDPDAGPPAAPGGPGRLADAAAFVLLLVLLVAVLDVARASSLTCDEVAHVGAALSYATSGSTAIESQHPPLVKLISGAFARALGGRAPTALALTAASDPVPQHVEWKVGERTIFEDNPELSMPGAGPGGDSVVVAARTPAVLFALLLAGSVYAWSRARHGPAGGLLSLGLAVAYPDLLGHAGLLEYDVPLGACAVAAGLALDRLLARGGAGNLVAFGVALGATLASKCSGVFFAVGFALVGAAALRWPADPAPASPRHPWGSGPAARRLATAGLAAVVVFGVASAFLCAAYLGANPFAAYTRAIELVRSYCSTRPLGYCAGVFGHRWWWWYFAAALAFKVPLGTLALLVASTVVLVRRRGGVRASFLSEACLLVPPVVFFVGMSYRALPAGTRYMIPVVPFALVSAGRLGPWAGTSRRRWALLGAALASSAVVTGLEMPFPATFTNLLAGGELRSYRVLDGSAVDYGGGLKRLAEWQRERGIERLTVVPFTPVPYQSPDGTTLVLNHFGPTEHLAAYGVRATQADGAALFAPTPGEVYAVSTHVLSHACAFARERGSSPPVLGETVPPSERVGGGFLIFDLRPPAQRAR